MKKPDSASVSVSNECPAGNGGELLLVINPLSGTMSKDGVAERLASRLEGSGMRLSSVVTERVGHAAELARGAVARGAKGVIVAGGDGTVNEVARELRSSNTALGILPYGSGNGLARHLLGSIDLGHAMDVVAAAHIEACDYGTANGQPFFCTFGMGFDATVSREFANMPTRGLASYIRSAVQQYARFSPTRYEITTGDRRLDVKAFLVAVCNASQYGNNAFIAPQASLRDGLLDIVVIHAGNPLTRALAGVELFTGRLDKNVLIESMRVRSAIIRHTPGAAHYDGEPIIAPETVYVESHSGDIRIFTDPSKGPFRPFLTPIESLQADSAFLLRENARIALRQLASALKMTINQLP